MAIQWAKIVRIAGQKPVSFYMQNKRHRLISLGRRRHIGFIENHQKKTTKSLQGSSSRLLPLVRLSPDPVSVCLSMNNMSPVSVLWLAGMFRMNTELVYLFIHIYLFLYISLGICLTDQQLFTSMKGF